MRTTFCKFFLPLMLVAFLATTAKAELVVMEPGVTEPVTDAFAAGGYKDYFTDDQWSVLNFGEGYLTLGEEFWLMYTDPFEFAVKGSDETHSVTFDRATSSVSAFDGVKDLDWGEFIFDFSGEGILNELSLIIYLTDVDPGTEYVVDFTATAALQNPTEAAVPEPGTLAIFGVAVIAGGFAARRRRK